MPRIKESEKRSGNMQIAALRSLRQCWNYKCKQSERWRRNCCTLQVVSAPIYCVWVWLMRWRTMWSSKIVTAVSWHSQPPFKHQCRQQVVQFKCQYRLFVHTLWYNPKEHLKYLKDLKYCPYVSRGVLCWTFVVIFTIISMNIVI